MFRRHNDLQPLSPDFARRHWQKPIFQSFPEFFTRMESMDQPIYAGYGWKEIIRCMCEELRSCLDEERERERERVGVGRDVDGGVVDGVGTGSVERDDEVEQEDEPPTELDDDDESEEEDRESADLADSPTTSLPTSPPYTFIDIWDKYGSLRIKSHPSPSLSPQCLARIFEIEDTAGIKSVTTCVGCGEGGRMGSFGGWMEVMCGRCARGKGRDGCGNWVGSAGEVVEWEDGYEYEPVYRDYGDEDYDDEDEEDEDEDEGGDEDKDDERA